MSAKSKSLKTAGGTVHTADRAPNSTSREALDDNSNDQLIANYNERRKRAVQRVENIASTAGFSIDDTTYNDGWNGWVSRTAVSNPVDLGPLEDEDSSDQTHQLLTIKLDYSEPLGSPLLSPLIRRLLLSGRRHYSSKNCTLSFASNGQDVGNTEADDKQEKDASTPTETIYSLPPIIHDTFTVIRGPRFEQFTGMNPVLCEFETILSTIEGQLSQPLSVAS